MGETKGRSSIIFKLSMVIIHLYCRGLLPRVILLIVCPAEADKAFSSGLF